MMTRWQPCQFLLSACLEVCCRPSFSHCLVTEAESEGELSTVTSVQSHGQLQLHIHNPGAAVGRPATAHKTRNHPVKPSVY